jgi:hypothetical protein
MVERVRHLRRLSNEQRMSMFDGNGRIVLTPSPKKFFNF